MASSTDFQRWQTATNGINKSGQEDLSREEWSALVKLNNCLQNGNFDADESFHALMLLKKNLSSLANNRILQMHLQDFIALCEQYGCIENTQTRITTDAASPSYESSHSNSVNTKGRINKNLIFIISALVASYLVYANWNSLSGALGFKQTEITTVKVTSTTDPGVVINGVKWASRNVDAPGTFAATPESAGMFYQWNRKTGWSMTDPLVNSDGGTVWDRTMPEGTAWEATNDPSPPGWRVPGLEEFKALLDTVKVYSEEAILNGVNGIRFTDKNNGNSIFLPKAGYRSQRVTGNTILLSAGNYGHYWSSSQDFRDNYGKARLFRDYAYSLEVFSNLASTFSDFGCKRIHGLSVRSIAKNKDELSNEIKNDNSNNKNNSNQAQLSPPIENTNGYANASILLPKDWDGTSIMANGFVWIFIDDKKLQDKYNVHPGDTYEFFDDHEGWDDDDNFYKYPLSPDIVIEAGIMSDSGFRTRKMTVNEFAIYMRNLGYVIKDEDNYGMVANITYENRMITNITEKYVP